MAAIIHPSTHPMPDAAVRRRPAPPALRLLPGAHSQPAPRLPTHRPRPSAAVLRRRRLVVALVAGILSTVLVAAAWVTLQAWAPTPPPLPGATAGAAPG